MLIPPQSGVVATASGAGSTAATPTASSVGDGDADTDDVGATTTATPVSTSSNLSSGGGSYVVQPSDTLSGIAARAGLTVAELAAANGIDPTRRSITRA